MRQLLVFVSIVACALAVDTITVPDLGNYWVLQEPDGKLSMFRWDEAMQQCYNKGGHLVVVNSQTEADAVADIMNKYGIKDYAHVGFSDLLSEGYYTTIKDETLKEAGYSAWANGYPNGGRTSNCGAINSRGELLDISCRQILPVICEASNWDMSISRNNNGNYKLHEEELPWSDAMERCQQEGGNLVVIDSEEEAKIVTRMLAANSILLGHIGLHDRYISRVFFTVNGHLIWENEYHNWAENEPAQDPERNFVAMDQMGKYHTIYENTDLPFICEYPRYSH